MATGSEPTRADRSTFKTTSLCINAIDKLSDDLLSLIFLDVRGIPYMFWYSTRLLWVCRRWFFIIRSMALFWRTIEIESDPDVPFIQTCLRYSQQTPLRISLRSMKKFSATVSALSGDFERIQSLIIETPRATLKDSSLVTLLHQPLPSLEKLALTFPPIRKSPHPLVPGRPDRDPFIWTPQHFHYPNITHLSLGRRVSIAGALPVFPKLRRLELRDNFEPEFTLASFVQFLSHHAHLEELVLSNYRPLIEPIHKSFTFPATLRKFSLADSAHYVEPFLSSFEVIPSQVRLSLTRLHDVIEEDDELDYWNLDLSIVGMLPDIDLLGDMDGREDDDEDEDEDNEANDEDNAMEDEDDEEQEREDEGGNKEVRPRARCLPLQNNDLHVRFPVLFQVTSVEIGHYKDNHYTLHGRAFPGDLHAPPLVSFTTQLPPRPSIEHRKTFRLFDDMIIVFGSAPLTELYISSHGGAGFSVEDWATLLSAFPKLEHIAIEHTVPAEPPFDARYGLLKALEAGWGRQVRRLTLATFRFAYWPGWTMDMCFQRDTLPKCLSTRIAMGRKIEELHLLSTERYAKLLAELERTLTPLVNTFRISFIKHEQDDRWLKATIDEKRQ